MARKKRFHPATKAEPGNLKAVKHGAHSKQLLAPVRQRLKEQLLERYPQMDEPLAVLLASRMAKVELGEGYMDRHGIFRDEETGEVFPIADRVEKWSRRCEDLLRAAGVQRNASSPVDLALALAALSGSEGDE